MPEVKRTSILEAADRLATELKALPADERRDKALYHLQRLQLSVNASHSEAVRFAAFTVNKLVHDAEVELTPDLFRDFCSACDDVHAYLNELIEEKEVAKRRQAEREKQEAMARLRPSASSGAASSRGGGGDFSWKSAAGLAVGVVGLGIYYWRQLTR